MDSITAKEIMVPRIDCVSISVDTPQKEIIDIINSKGHSRIPVWEKNLDNIVGILYAKDLLKYFKDENPPNIREFLRPAYFIPESKMIISLLAEFKTKHLHFACVVDEYGGFSGIVTMEDVLEELVGDIQDEYDMEEEDVVAISDQVFMIDARLSIIDFNERFGFNIPNDECDTIGGFLFELFGKVPSKKEKITYRDQIEFEVVNITGNKINKIKLTKTINEPNYNL